MSRRALLVAVENCRGAPLFGPVNDVAMMKDLLDSLDLEPAFEVEVLENSAAKSSDLLRRLDALVNDAVDGDTLLFFFAGHGTRIASDFGNEQEREAICPSDFEIATGEHAIPDFELHRRFEVAENKGAKLTAIFDCCFAGGLPLEDVYRRLRELGTEKFGAPFQELSTGLSELLGLEGARYIPIMGQPLARLYELARDQPLHSVAPLVRERAADAVNPAVVFGACRAQEIARESNYDGRREGVFTHHFVELLTTRGANLANADIRDEVRAATKAENHKQAAVVHPDTGRFLG